jgi:hypothetical protein
LNVGNEEEWDPTFPTLRRREITQWLETGEEHSSSLWNDLFLSLCRSSWNVTDAAARMETEVEINR